MKYRIILSPDDNGTLLVTCPALPEVTTFGEDVEDARRRSAAAILEAIAARISDAFDIPGGPNVPKDDRPFGSDHPVVYAEVPALAAIKVQLYRACREQKVTRAELTRRLGWARNSVDRLFLLDHQSRLDQLEAAARALGLELDARLEPVAA